MIPRELIYAFRMGDVSNKRLFRAVSLFGSKDLTCLRYWHIQSRIAWDHQPDKGPLHLEPGELAILDAKLCQQRPGVNGLGHTPKPVVEAIVKDIGSEENSGVDVRVPDKIDTKCIEDLRGEVTGVPEDWQPEFI